MSEKTRYDKRDYYALQETWRDIIHQYTNTRDPRERVVIIDILRDSLVDVAETGKMALYSEYIEWEQIWEKLVEQELHATIEEYPNDFQDDDDERRQKDIITQIFNYKRYMKIRQIIQDSGIGLGSKKERYHGELQGFMG